MMQQQDILIEPTLPIHKPRISYLGQLGILLGMIGVGIIVGGLSIAIVWKVMTGASLLNMEKDMVKPQFANAARIVQLVYAFFMFLLPAIVTALIISKKSFAYLGFTTKLTANQILTVIALAFFALILSGVLGELNQIIPIPKNWATKFKAMEDNYNTSVMAMAQMKNFKAYLFVLVVIALAPALFEEVLFRAGLQQILINWTKRPILSIIITSIIFSAVHVSYYGFLPRAALGVVLGLIFYYSKNIWLSILLHLLNNGISITLLYLYSKNGKPSQEVMDAKVSAMYGVIAAIIAGAVAVTAVVLLLKHFITISKKINPTNPAIYLRREENPFQSTVYDQ